MQRSGGGALGAGNLAEGRAYEERDARRVGGSSSLLRATPSPTPDTSPPVRGQIALPC